jgi:hypothetical protein
VFDQFIRLFTSCDVREITARMQRIPYKDTVIYLSIGQLNDFIKTYKEIHMGRAPYPENNVLVCKNMSVAFESKEVLEEIFDKTVGLAKELVEARLQAVLKKEIVKAEMSAEAIMIG